MKIDILTLFPEGRTYYHPGDQGLEKRIKERLEFWRKSINPTD